MLVAYIRGGEWCRNVFVNEPSRGPAISVVGYWADNLMSIA